MTAKIYAPWTAEQTEALNLFQISDLFHPFTCGWNDVEGHSEDRVLVATTSGWICPSMGCKYHQDWAHASMADKEFIEGHRKTMEALFRGNEV